jgi:hypothetical protein
MSFQTNSPCTHQTAKQTHFVQYGIEMLNSIIITKNLRKPEMDNYHDQVSYQFQQCIIYTIHY